MAATILFTCVCGVQKKTSNHWVLARIDGSRVSFMPWEDHLALQPDITVLCGEGCAASMLSRSLSDWKHSLTQTEAQTEHQTRPALVA